MNTEYPQKYRVAAEYAVQLLELHLPGRYLYHSILHTRDVLKYSDIFAEKSGLSAEERNLLHVAAAFHDTGYVYDPEHHESESSSIAAAVLKDLDFSDGEIARVSELILHTRMGESPASLTGMILRDADVEYLGRSEFYHLSTLLRQELYLGGNAMSEPEWLRFEIKFLTGFAFASPVAHKLRAAGVAKHLRELEHCLNVIENEEQRAR